MNDKEKWQQRVRDIRAGDAKRHNDDNDMWIQISGNIQSEIGQEIWLF